jgi:chromatin structure-remodeling complex subunit SFH1
VRQYGNALLTPVYPVQTGPTPRTTKRGTTAINYAEDGYDDDDFDESDGPRRPTGLRSLRREESTGGMMATSEKLGKEVHAPVEVQGVFREWMIKRMLRPAYVVTSSSCDLWDLLTWNVIVQVCGPATNSSAAPFDTGSDSN